MMGLNIGAGRRIFTLAVRLLDVGFEQFLGIEG